MARSALKASESKTVRPAIPDLKPGNERWTITRECPTCLKRMYENPESKQMECRFCGVPRVKVVTPAEKEAEMRRRFPIVEAKGERCLSPTPT